MENLNERIRNRKSNINPAASAVKNREVERKFLIEEARKRVLDYVGPYGFHEYGKSSVREYLTIWHGSVLRGNLRPITAIEIKIKSDCDHNDCIIFNFINHNGDYLFPINNMKYFEEGKQVKEWFWAMLDEMIVQYGSVSSGAKNYVLTIAILTGIIFLGYLIL